MRAKQKGGHGVGKSSTAGRHVTFHQLCCDVCSAVDPRAYGMENPVFQQLPHHRVRYGCFDHTTVFTHLEVGGDELPPGKLSPAVVGFKTLGP